MEDENGTIWFFHASEIQTRMMKMGHAQHQIKHKKATAGNQA
jgi:hypothetical protein